MLTAALASIAIVTQNQASLRASPRESATQQAVMWQGEALEIRGQRMDYLQVYDHRRERGGYILASQVRTTSAAPEEAPELLAVVRFLRDTPGAEALGISYAAAYLKAVPAKDITAEPFAALGSMADRLARRSTVNQIKANEATLAAHLEVVAQQGITMKSFERDGSMQICYDGEMFRRVLAMPSADAAQKAHAALGLTRHECVDPNLGPTERYRLDRWRADVLDRAPLTGLPPSLINRLHLRRAGVWSAVAFEQTRRGEAPLAAGQRALEELAAVNKMELSDNDQVEYTAAAVRVGASRWAAEPAIAAPGKLTISTEAGAPGETCVLLQDAKHDAKHPLARRCTFGTVWPASASSNAAGTALALAVQPLDTWRELWVFRQTSDQGKVGWTIDVLPPGTNNPNLGYLEFAGWVPGSNRMLVAREVKADGPTSKAGYLRRFEVLNIDTLTVDKQAAAPEQLQAFRWQSPAWKRQTVAVR